MPRFLLTFIFLLGASLLNLVWLVVKISPEPFINRGLFFISVFSFSFSLTALGGYGLFCSNVLDRNLRRDRFKKLLKLCFLISGFLTLTLILKVVGALSGLNFLLLAFLILSVALYIHQ